MNPIVKFLSEVQGMTLLLWRSIKGLGKQPRYFGEIIQQMDSIGVGSLSIVILTGFFTGGVLILQAYPRSFITAQPVTASAFCMVPGVIKEAYDARRGAPGAWSWKDIAADAIGCGIGVAGDDLFLTRDGKRYTLGWNVMF